MKMAETVFVDGRPVGQIVQDGQSGAVDFVPGRRGDPKPARPYNDLDDLKAQLRALYGRGTDAKHK